MLFATSSNAFEPRLLSFMTSYAVASIVQHTQFWWGCQTGMARGAVRSQFLSLRHTKITQTNTENLTAVSRSINSRHVRIPV